MIAAACSAGDVEERIRDERAVGGELWGGESFGGGGAIIIVRAPLRKFVVTNATTLRCVLTAPFGRPVVPLV